MADTSTEAYLSPPVVGDLSISITDPIKNDQGVVKSFISYKVNTDTTMDSFEFKQLSVIRRYSVS